MGKVCRDVYDVIPETIVLAFEVAGWEAPSNVSQIKRNKALMGAISKEISSQGKAIIAKHFKGGEAVSEKDALNMLAGAGGKFADNRKDELTDRVNCAYKDSPLGVWIDKNNWILYLVVPLVVGGAGTWMYIAKVGDTPASWAAPMANVKKDWKIKHLGKITIGTKGAKFVPSKREIAAKAFVSADMERVRASITVGGGMADAAASPVSIDTAVMTAVTRNVSVGLNNSIKDVSKSAAGQSKIDLSYKGSGAGSNLSLAVSGVVAYDSDNVTSAGANLGASITGKFDGAPAKFGAKAGYKRNFSDLDKPANEFSVMFSLEVGL